MRKLKTENRVFLSLIQGIQRLGGHELFEALVVVDALHQVFFQFGVEEGHGQSHQFQEEVGQQSYVDAYADMQQQPPAYEVDRSPSYGQHQLPQQNQVDEVQVLSVYSLIYHCLRQEGEEQL